MNSGSSVATCTGGDLHDAAHQPSMVSQHSQHFRGLFGQLGCVVHFEDAYPALNACDACFWRTQASRLSIRRVSSLFMHACMPCIQTAWEGVNPCHSRRAHTHGWTLKILLLQGAPKVLQQTSKQCPDLHSASSAGMARPADHAEALYAVAAANSYPCLLALLTKRSWHRFGWCMPNTLTA